MNEKNQWRRKAMKSHFFARVLVLQCLLQLFPCAKRADGQAESKPRKEAVASRSAQCIRLLKEPVILVDPVSGSGEASLLLTNQTEKKINAALLGATVSPPNSPVVVEFSGDGGGASSQLYQVSIPGKSTVTARVLVRNVWDDGEFDIELTNHYGAEKLGKVHVKRIPVGVKLEGADRLKLALVHGVQTRILIRNDDPKNYSVTWRLVNGQRVCEGLTGPVDLSPKSLTVLECTPELKWSLANLLKPDQSHDGYNLLLLSHEYPGGPKLPEAVHPLKAFKGEASADYFTPFKRGLLSYPILATILLLGGVSSLVLSYFVPNKLKRLALRDQLLALAARTSDLTTRIDTKLAVLVRLERSRLSDLLKSCSTISPDFTAIAGQCATGTAALAQKVSVLEAMDLVLDRLNRRISQGVPPAQIIEISQKLDLAAALLGKVEGTVSDIQTANSAVSDAAVCIDQLNQPNDAFAGNLSQSIRDLVSDLDQTLQNSQTYQAITQKLPGPMRSLRAAIMLPSIPLDKYVEFDVAAEKMRTVREYVLLVEEANDNDRVARLKAREDQLVSHLQAGTWPSLTLASQLLREMRDDVFPERVAEMLRAPGMVSINVDPPVAYERSPLELSVSFQRPDLNTAAAREKIEVDWDFGDGLKGKGWSIYHYFQIRGRRKSYNLAVIFRYPDGKVLTDAQGQPVTVKHAVDITASEIGRGVGERTRLELLKLGIALLVAVFGLVSGAQDQIARLDVLPGIIAVFLVGFTADSIKRLLTA